MGCPAYQDQDASHYALMHSRGQSGAVSDIAGQLAETYGLHRQRHLTMGGGGYQTDIDYTKINGLSQTPCMHFTTERHALSDLNDNNPNHNFQMHLMAAAGAMVAELKGIILEISAMGEDLSTEQKADFVKAIFNTYQIQEANENRITLTAGEMKTAQQSFETYIKPLRSNIAIVEMVGDSPAKAPALSQDNAKSPDILDGVKNATIAAADLVTPDSPKMSNIAPATQTTSTPEIKKAETAISQPTIAPSTATQPTPIASDSQSIPAAQQPTPIASISPTSQNIPVTPQQVPTQSYTAASITPIASIAPAALSVPQLQTPLPAPVVQQVARVSDIITQNKPSFSAVTEVALLQQQIPQTNAFQPMRQELQAYQTHAITQIATQTNQSAEVIKQTIAQIVAPQEAPQPPAPPVQPQEIPEPEVAKAPPVAAPDIVINKPDAPVAPPPPPQPPKDPVINTVPEKPAPVAPPHNPVRPPEPVSVQKNPTEPTPPPPSTGPTNPTPVVVAPPPPPPPPLPVAFNPPAQPSVAPPPPTPHREQPRQQEWTTPTQPAPEWKAPPVTGPTWTSQPNTGPSWKSPEPQLGQQQQAYKAPDVIAFPSQNPHSRTPTQTTAYKAPDVTPIIQIKAAAPAPAKSTGSGCAGCFTKACGNCGLGTSAVSTATASNNGQKAAQKMSYDSFNP